MIRIQLAGSGASSTCRRSPWTSPWSSDREVRAGDLLQAISDIESPLLSGTRIFDVYEGAQVPEGRKSVAINFTFQGEETLTDADVKAEVDRITSRLGDDFGAQVRTT